MEIEDNNQNFVYMEEENEEVLTSIPSSSISSIKPSFPAISAIDASVSIFYFE